MPYCCIRGMTCMPNKLTIPCTQVISSMAYEVYIVNGPCQHHQWPMSTSSMGIIGTPPSQAIQGHVGIIKAIIIAMIWKQFSQDIIF